MTERDVVVIGGGIAGLSAAWRLRHRDVLLLEAADRLGGRLRSDPRGDYWLNYGAHLFPAPGTLVDSMARDCGLETVPVTGSMMGLAVGSTLLNRGRVETYPFRLPLSLRERVAFAKAGLKVQRAVAQYQRLAKGTRREDERARVLAFEGERTFADFLGALPPAVDADLLLRGPARHGGAVRAVGGLRHRPVRAGVGRQGHADRPQPARRHGPAAGRARPRARRPRPHRMPGERAAARRGRAARRLRGPDVRARHVIVAAQAPFAAPLVAPVAREAAAALEQLTYGAFLERRGRDERDHAPCRGTTSTRWRPRAARSTCSRTRPTCCAARASAGPAAA